MLFELDKTQLDHVIQSLDVSLKSGGINNLKPVSELLFVFQNPVDNLYTRKEVTAKQTTTEEKKEEEK